MRSFVATERCDRCGAQAHAAATKGGSELLFCGHHQREYLDTLIYGGWVVESEEALEHHAIAPAYTD